MFKQEIIVDKVPHAAIKFYCAEQNRTYDQLNNVYNDSPAGSYEPSFWPELATFKARSPKDPESFKKVVESGRVKMTNYFNKSNETFRPIVEVDRISTGRTWTNHRDSDGSHDMKQTVQDTGAYRIRYQEISDPGYYFPDSDVLLQQTMAKMVAKSVNQYDLLTEYAERVQTAGTIISVIKALINPVKAFIKLRSRIMSKRRSGEPLSAALADELADAWLQFRYAIMPIFYSAQDLVEQVEKRSITYETFKDFVVIQAECDDPDVTCNIKRTIRVVARNKYGDRNRLEMTTSINPFLTAWELVPLSFVIDWFLNVGDFILANTTFPSQDRKYCYSIKDEGTIVKSKTWPSQTVPSQFHDAPEGPDRDLYFPSVNYGNESTHVVYRHKVQHYERVVFNPSDVDLQLSCDGLSLFQTFDAVSLSYKTLRKVLRRLI